MKTYTDAVFDGIRARGWKLRLFAYLGHDHRRMFCADAERAGGEHVISHEESMLAALLNVDARCQAAGVRDPSALPLNHDGEFAD